MDKQKEMTKAEKATFNKYKRRIERVEKKILKVLEDNKAVLALHPDSPISNPQIVVKLTE
tara:strand:- start:247 stop:426 length:180 start_codon:yes stop_codon:yes gene_type:complete